MGSSEEIGNTTNVNSCECYAYKQKNNKPNKSDIESERNSKRSGTDCREPIKIFRTLGADGIYRKP